MASRACERGNRARKRSRRIRRWIPVLSIWLFTATGCLSRCDPAVVPMPEGYDDITFNTQVGDVLRRGATEYGNNVVVWRRGIPVEVTYQGDAEKFRSFYESCDDSELCDEVIYNFERGESGYHLTAVRFGGPLLGIWDGEVEPGVDRRDRCDYYKALARDLWDDPDRDELEGRLEVFEISDRVWGAVLCTEMSGGELLVAKTPRIKEIYR